MWIRKKIHSECFDMYESFGMHLFCCLVNKYYRFTTFFPLRANQTKHLKHMVMLNQRKKLKTKDQTIFHLVIE